MSVHDHDLDDFDAQPEDVPGDTADDVAADVGRDDDPLDEAEPRSRRLAVAVVAGLAVTIALILAAVLWTAD